jgi:hypothetical protein
MEQSNMLSSYFIEQDERKNVEVWWALLKITLINFNSPLPTLTLANHVPIINVINMMCVIISPYIQNYNKINHKSLQEIMVYLIGKLNQKPIILIVGQFDHLIILDKLIKTCSTWLVIFLIDHKMVFMTNQIEQKIG